MATLLLFVLLFFSAALLVMVIYTIDRLNSVEKITSLLNTVVAPSPSVSGVEAPSMFEGLTGMVLWEAMSGKPVEGWDKESLDEMRPRYQIVLQKHIEAIFDEGLLDGHQESFKHLPANGMVVSMLRGTVESWMPQNYASSIYQLGIEWSRNEIEEAERLRERLDLIVDELFSDCEIELKNPISNSLMPVSEEELLRKSNDSEMSDSDEELGETMTPALSNESEGSTSQINDVQEAVANKNVEDVSKPENQTDDKSKGEVSSGVRVPEPVA
ncbi:MAG: hypothetical protein CBD16_02880 [Betaproteobacteria bacterium TMED156]|nr:MAG: hypothetical protein CBD16_02880 [Betaproteobacteria bacterium TMED156]